MIDRTSLVTISFVVLLVHLLSCSGAPADASSLHFDTTETGTESTTDSIVQSVVKVIDSTESEEIVTTDSTLLGVTIVPINVSSLSLIDPESIVIEIAPDNVLSKKDKQDLSNAEETSTVDSIVQDSTAILADPVDENVSESHEGSHEILTTPTTENEEESSIEMTDEPGSANVVVLKVDISNPSQTEPFESPTTVQPEEIRNAFKKEENQELDQTESTQVIEVSTETSDSEDTRRTESILIVKNDIQSDEVVTAVTVSDVTESSTLIPEDTPEEFRAAFSVTDPVEDTTVQFADPIEDVTVQSTDSTADSTDSTNFKGDEIERMEPQLVKIFDPSVDVEATTYLAEANQQTEPSVTTEFFLQADEADFRVEEEVVTLVTAEEESVTVTTQIGTEVGTESATESGTEVMSETTALPAIKEQPEQPVQPILSVDNSNKPAISNSNKRRSYKGYKVYRVILPTEESVRRILSMEDEPGVEFWADPRLLLRPRGLFVTSAADVMVAPKMVPQIESVFRQARLTYTVLINDVHTSILKENPSGQSFARSQTNPSSQHQLTWERYHRLADINSYLDHLKKAYADWVEVLPIGKSSQGRPIHVIKLSRRRQPARVEPSQKKAILIDAGIHANEWITPAALTWMVNELVENADSYGCILDRFDWYFVPMVNPDGYEYSHAVDRMWRKTRRNYTSTLVRSSARKLRVDIASPDDEQCVGADINRNFEFHWRKGGSSSNVCSPSYAGVKPFSEPESRALANFMLKQRSRLAMYISLHSYSQMWLLPWGFAETRPEDFSKLYSLAKIGARALQRVHNTSYLIGSVPDLLALASGTSQDWAKGVAGVKYSYTLEMRDAGERGMILPAQQIIPTAEETWAGIYAAAVELAHRFYDYLPSCSPF